MKRTIKLFEKELNLIENLDLRSLVKDYMIEETADYFWTDGASSSGRYHPKFSQGDGGLVRHTKSVVMFAEELMRTGEFTFNNPMYHDYVIAACILHDTKKYGMGEYNKSEYKFHADNAADAFEQFCLDRNYHPSEIMLNAMRGHMGKWSTNQTYIPCTPVDHCVHLADYVASRKFIDIPELTEEWENVEIEEVEEDMSDIPFTYEE